MDKVLYGLSGEAGSGKDSFADIMVFDRGFVKMSFAQKLKDICGVAFNLTYAQLNTQEGKMTILETPRTLNKDSFSKIIMEIGKTHSTPEIIVKLDNLSRLLLPQNLKFKRPRDILQFVGTEIVRTVDENYWITVLEKQIASSKQNVIVTDCRFPNERALIKKLGGTIIRIKRDDNPIEAGVHATESSFGEDKSYDIVLNNNSTLEDFIDTVRSNF
jgi:hypothetical protein